MINQVSVYRQPSVLRG
ncbi:hypothetical protein JQN32_26190 [Escherichia coli]|nr:hypothetical protein [Escherichia coli]MBM0887601.1 hypothetical protein [Escherichia coli]